MKSAVCVDQLTLESVVTTLFMGGGAETDQRNHEELPILTNAHLLDATTNNKAHPPLIGKEENHAAERTLSETAATVASADDEIKQEQEVEAEETRKRASSTAQRTPGFVERIVREYTIKREIQQLITKKQQQLKHMQTLITNYQETLSKAILQLHEQAQKLQSDSVNLKSDARKELAELFVTGGDRARIETTRCVGLLEVQQNRILQDRVALRLTVVQTRQEECEWLLKSIVLHHEKECDQLLEASTTKSFLENGSFQATVAVQITQNDPIFATIEQLFESSPQAKQIQLQLSSMESVLATMKQRLHAGASGPVPLVKRASLRKQQQQQTTETFPSMERKREVRLSVLEGKRLRSSSSSCGESNSIMERHLRYTRHLHQMGRLLSDLRTRSGSLLHQFVCKLQQDTQSWVYLTSSDPPPPSIGNNNNNHEKEPNEESPKHVYDPKRDFPNRYYVPRFSSLLDQPQQLAEDQHQPSHVLLYEGVAVDTQTLPPPAMIASFTKFLTRVITTEYELLTAPPSSSSSSSSSATDRSSCSSSSSSNASIHPEPTPTSPSQRSPSSSKGDQGSLTDCTTLLDHAVLHDCVHEMVFSKIPLISTACAVDEFHFHQSDPDEEADSDDHHSHRGFLFPDHWIHSKLRLQQIPLRELEFPDDVMTALTLHFQAHAKEIQQHGFLPQTLALFRATEREITPKGIVRAVMAGFQMLHRELVEVLTTTTENDEGGGESDLTGNKNPTTRRPRRQLSCFLNADVLIPSLVLMMSRVPYDKDLNELWRQVVLVTRFRTVTLSAGDGGEEAYYMTCLEAAMAFIQTYEPTMTTTPREHQQPESVSSTACLLCTTRRQEIHQRSIRIEEKQLETTTATAATAATTMQNEKQRIVKMRSKRSLKKPWSKTDQDSIKQLSKWISDQPPTPDVVVSLCDAERIVSPVELWTHTHEISSKTS